VRNILVVDNSDSIIETISNVLEKEGYSVTGASDGVDALQKLQMGTRFNVIIADENMPNMDGVSLTREIKKIAAYEFTPIIFLCTMSSSWRKKEEGKIAGAAGWLMKPFAPENLVAVIRKVSP